MKFTDRPTTSVVDFVLESLHIPCKCNHEMYIHHDGGGSCTIAGCPCGKFSARSIYEARRLIDRLRKWMRGVRPPQWEPLWELLEKNFGKREKDKAS